MNDQHQHSAQHLGAGPSHADDPDTGSAERLAAAREKAQRIFAAADSILDGIRQSDSQRFLEQVRQSGGQ